MGMHRRIGRQGGWVGLIVILLALVIVAWLSKDALKKYGLMSDLEKQPKATATTESVRGAGIGVSGAAPDITSGHARTAECPGKGARRRGNAQGTGGRAVPAD